MNETRGELEINLRDVLGVLLKRWWIILLATLLGGALLFGYAHATYTPCYRSTALMYVNNNNNHTTTTGTGITQNDILAAQLLVKTYCVIIESNSTMEEVIKKAGLNYTTSQLLRMVTCGSKDETEVFYISVTSNDKDEARTIARTLVEILPSRIASVIEGASTTMVDDACVAKQIHAKYTAKAAVGALMGFLASFALLFLYDVIINDTLQTESWIVEAYKGDIPLLAVVPDVNYSGGKRYGRYRYYRRYQYYESKTNTTTDAQ